MSRYSDDDLEPRAAEPEVLCELCEALESEPHQPSCPLFVPLCACGKTARRVRGDEWVCGSCDPVGVRRGAA